MRGSHMYDVTHLAHYFNTKSKDMIGKRRISSLRMCFRVHLTHFNRGRHTYSYIEYDCQYSVSETIAQYADIMGLALRHDICMCCV